jgi:hypothetical protein
MDQNAAIDSRLTRAVIGALREHDLSGFEVWQWLGPVPYASGELSETAVFPTLHSLEERRLIEGAWREGGDGTRRRYRLTARGLALADREGWGPVAFERYGPTRYGARDSSSPSPAVGRVSRRGTREDSSGWAWPAATAPTTANADTAIEAASVDVGSIEPAEPASAPEVEAFLHTLQSALHLAPTYCSDVCHEVADYVTDAMSRLTILGSTPVEASAEVLAALGPPADLAGRINEAQLTASRLRAGMSWGSAVATLTFVVGFVIAFDIMSSFTPWLVGLFTPLLGNVGVHIYAPWTAEWDSQWSSVALSVGAFVGARRSMPFLADRSRQSDTVVWRAWALAGGLPLAALALLMPFSMDPLSALLMLAPPVMWVLGTRRPAVLYGPTMTVRGMAICVVAVLVLNFLPAGRVWFYSTQPPAAEAEPRAEATATLIWTNTVVLSTQAITVSDLPAGWHGAQVCLWPAARFGPSIAPDAGAWSTTDCVESGKSIDFTALPGNQLDWWVTATALGPGGRTYLVYSGPHYGFATVTHSSMLGWLLSR